MHAEQGAARQETPDEDAAAGTAEVVVVDAPTYLNVGSDSRNNRLSLISEPESVRNDYDYSASAESDASSGSPRSSNRARRPTNGLRYGVYGTPIASSAHDVDFSDEVRY